MPTYIGALNQMIASTVGGIPGLCLFGQNIDTGTYITGLTRNLPVPPGGRIVNTQNSENSLCGMGFGVLLAGGRCVYFAKQLDFMVLGIDHFINTYNLIRCSPAPQAPGSFTIIALVCDQGLQGPQSSFNSFGDFCSIARIPCYSLTNNQDAAQILGSELTKPGFRMIGLSSRMFKTEFLQMEKVHAAADGSVFQYTEGDGATIACFNFSLPHGRALQQKLAEKGVAASLFSVNYVPQPQWAPIVASARATRKLVVLDDSKSVHLPAYRLLDDVAQAGQPVRRWIVTRGPDVDFGMSTEEFRVDVDALAAGITA